MAEITNAKVPLYKRVHWRCFRAFLSELCKKENINISDFNTNKIMCYETTGDQLKGSNVKYSPNNLSCWVGDNHYEIYEIPSKDNHEKSLSGKFLIVAYNKDFDYWVLSYMDHGIRTKESKKQSRIVEDVLFTVIGKFTASLTNKKNKISKLSAGNEIDLRRKCS